MSVKETTGRVLEGEVISNKMDKTIVVRIERRVTHPVYEKVMTKRTKVHAHDENNQCKEGDRVLIKETRPISKTKSWSLVQVLEQVS